jgi:hypothetical protein
VESLRGLLIFWALLNSPRGDFLSYWISKPNPEQEFEVNFSYKERRGFTLQVDFIMMNET